jgi:hypothetical protein
MVAAAYVLSGYHMPHVARTAPAPLPRGDFKVRLASPARSSRDDLQLHLHCILRFCRIFGAALGIFLDSTCELHIPH